MITKTKGKQQKKDHKILPKSVLPRHVLPICPVVTFQSSIWAKGQKAGPHMKGLDKKTLRELWPNGAL